MYAEILILGELMSGPKHGYEIKRNIQNALGDEFEINNNLLYPALRRFVEMGAISKEVIQTEGKPNRHVYCLTETGEEIFQEMICDFPSKLAARQIEFLVRVALFDRLEPEIQQEIMRNRQEVLQKKLEYYRKVEQDHVQNPYVLKVIDFQRAQTELELEWIQSLSQEMDQ
jgi:DNA-binding PadR family transcriptional regulator